LPDFGSGIGGLLRVALDNDGVVAASSGFVIIAENG